MSPLDEEISIEDETTMTNSGSDGLETLAPKVSENMIAIWREAMTHLRQLHGDVWNGLRFFLALNGLIFAGIAALVLKMGGDGAWYLAIYLIPLGVLGVLLTRFARYILTKHREYYVDMLLKKTLIEDTIGFYDINLGKDVDGSFPWNVPKKRVGGLKTGWWIKRRSKMLERWPNATRRYYIR